MEVSLGLLFLIHIAADPIHIFLLIPAHVIAISSLDHIAFTIRIVAYCVVFTLLLISVVQDYHPMYYYYYHSWISVAEAAAELCRG